MLEAVVERTVVLEVGGSVVEGWRWGRVGADVAEIGQVGRTVLAELAEDAPRHLIELLRPQTHALHRLLQEALDFLEVATDERLGQLELGLDGDELLAPVALAGVAEDGREEAREERARAGDADAVVVVRGETPR